MEQGLDLFQRGEPRPRGRGIRRASTSAFAPLPRVLPRLLETRLGPRRLLGRVIQLAFARPHLRPRAFDRSRGLPERTRRHLATLERSLNARLQRSNRGTRRGFTSLRANKSLRRLRLRTARVTKRALRVLHPPLGCGRRPSEFPGALLCPTRCGLEAVEFRLP